MAQHLADLDHTSDDDDAVQTARILMSLSDPASKLRMYAKKMPPRMRLAMLLAIKELSPEALMLMTDFNQIPNCSNSELVKLLNTIGRHFANHIGYTREIQLEWCLNGTCGGVCALYLFMGRYGVSRFNKGHTGLGGQRTTHIKTGSKSERRNTKYPAKAALIGAAFMAGFNKNPTADQSTRLVDAIDMANVVATSLKSFNQDQQKIDECLHIYTIRWAQSKAIPVSVIHLMGSAFVNGSSTTGQFI